jgi:hypothetical protein
VSRSIRIAPDWHLYPPLRSLPEPDLIPTVRVEFCACGVYVRQLMGDSIADTVRRHNATISHRAWRHQPDEAGPTAALSPVDVSEELPGASGRASSAGAA